MGSPNTQSGWFIERPDSPHGNFEVIIGPIGSLVPGPSPRGLAHFWNDNGSGDGSILRWNTAEATIYPDQFPGPFFGAALIMSNYGNLEAVGAQADGRLAHFALVGVWGWQGPVFVPHPPGGGPVAGPPAFIQSRFGSGPFDPRHPIRNRGNFEVIVPAPGGGLSHFFRDNTGEFFNWAVARQPITTGQWQGVGLIHSSYGNLEIVGVQGSDLVFMWQNGAGGPWSPEPRVIAHGYRGRPAFIQGPYGRTGNFEVVAARINGGLSHFWRDNDNPNLPWSGPYNFDEMVDSSAIFDDVSLIHDSFGFLNVLARQRNSTLVSHFRAPWAAPWQQPDTPWAFTFPTP